MDMRNRLLALGLVCLSALGTGAQGAPKLERVATETPLVAFDVGKVKDSALAVARDGRRFAFARKAEAGWSVEIDGKVEATYKDVGPVDRRFSPYPLGALRGIKPMQLSDDGRHLAYGVREAEGWAMVHDGKTGKSYKSIGGPVLDPNGRHLAYAAQVPGGWCVVSDDVVGKTYEKVGPPAISPDGLHVAYAARAAGKEMLVRDGVEGTAYESLDAPPGGVSGLLAKLLFSSIVPTWPNFSSDGRLAYMAKQAGKWYMVLEGTESEAFEHVYDPFFSPDGKRLAYAAKKEGSWSVLVDGKAYGSFEDEITTEIVFSADGVHFAFVAKTEGKEAVFVDGRRVGSHDEVGLPVFSPDGTRVAYTAKHDGKWTVTVDGVAQGAYLYRRAYNPVFSPDGSHLAFQAWHKGKTLVVVDGIEGRPYEDLLADLTLTGVPAVAFDENSCFHYLAVQGKQLLLVEERLSTEPESN
jgi:Tol biopolymer transport system component